MTKRTTNSIVITLALLAGVLFLTVFIVNAQVNSQATATPAATATSPPATTVSPATATGPQATPAIASPPPKVIAIEGHLELDDIVKVEVDHFTEWAATHDATKLVPFINGRAIRGNYPEEIHPDKNRLHFHLEITPENKEVWTDLLGEPHSLKRPVT